MNDRMISRRLETQTTTLVIVACINALILVAAIITTFCVLDEARARRDAETRIEKALDAAGFTR